VGSLVPEMNRRTLPSTALPESHGADGRREFSPSWLRGNLLPGGLTCAWLVMSVGAMFSLSQARALPFMFAIVAFGTAIAWTMVANHGLVVLLGAALALYWIPVPGYFQTAFFLNTPSIAVPLIIFLAAWCAWGRGLKGAGYLPLTAASWMFLAAGFVEVALFGLDPFSWTRLSLAVVFPVLVLYLCTRLTMTSARAWRFTEVFLWSTTLLCTVFVVGWTMGWIDSGLSAGEGASGRAGGVLTLPLLGLIDFGQAILSSNLSVVLPLGLVAALVGPKRSRVAGVVLLVAAALSMALTQGRGGIVAAVAAVGVLLLILMGQRLIRVRTGVIVGLLLAVVFVSLVVVLTHSVGTKDPVYRQRYEDPALTLLGTSAGPNVDNGRLANWAFHWASLRAHPLGVGWATTYDVYRPGQQPYPHNLLLLFGSALGFFGVGALLCLLAAVTLLLVRALRQRRWRREAAFAAAGLASLVAVMVSGITATTGVYDAYGACMVWLTIGLEILGSRAIDRSAESKTAAAAIAPAPRSWQWTANRAGRNSR